MQLTFNNKSNFCSKFLVPISRISDLSIISVNAHNVGEITSLNKTVDNNTILFAKCNDASLDAAQRVDLNVPDVKKFVKVFDCIEDETIVVQLNNNNIEYKSPKTKFKFHLLEDGIIAPLGHSLKKIESFEYDTHFKMDIATYNNIVRSSTFITESNKIYIYTDEHGVSCELTDKSRHNLDSFTTQLAERYEGAEIIKPLPFSFDNIRNVSTLRATELDIKINTSKGILCVDVQDEGYHLKYISTAMVV